MKTTRSTVRAGAAAIVIGLLAGACSAQTYQTPIALNNASVSTVTANSINNAGQVAGTAGFLSTGQSAFLWNPSAPATLVSLPRPKGYDFGVGRAINSAGDVAGLGAGGPFRIPQALFWPSGGAVQIIGPTKQTTQTEGYAINDFQDIVGWYPDQGAFLSQIVNGKRKLTIVGAGQGKAINSYGQILIAATTNGLAVSLWTPSTPRGTTQVSSIVLGYGNPVLNNYGQVALIALINGVYVPALWTPASANNGTTGTYTVLPHLALGPPQWSQYDSIAVTGINFHNGDPNQVQVVGTVQSVLYYDGGNTVIWSDNHAWIWDSVNGVRDLNDLIPAGSGWLLTDVAGINNSGWITGNGTLNGVGKAFVIKPN